MTDQFTSYSRTGYFGRIGNSIVGVLFGFVLVPAALVLLFWNEGRAVRTMRMLEEGAHSVITVSADSVNPANEGKLVHFTGAATGQTLTDPLLNVSADGIHLNRAVEMFQWKETENTESRKDTVGGGQTNVTTYTYSKTWSPRLIDSGHFKHADGHANPQAMRVASQSWTADPVKVGAFTIPFELVSRIDNSSTLPITEANRDHLPSDLKEDSAISDGVCYVSGRAMQTPDPSNPRVGDVRITMKLVPPGPVSVMARQTGSTLSAYTTHNGQHLELLHVGAHPAAEMIAAEQRKNGILTWILRGVGFVMMWIGFALVLQPVATVADVVGFIGSIVGMGLGLAAFLIAGMLSSLTIAIAWVAYRPLVGIALLVVCAVLTWAIIVFRRKRRAPATPAQPAAQNM